MEPSTGLRVRSLALLILNPTLRTDSPAPFVALEAVGWSKCVWVYCLQDSFQLHPEAFELNHHGESRLEDDFSVVYFNFNGLDVFKHAELLAFMSSSSVNALVLIDARVPKHHACHYIREARAELVPGSICLMVSPSFISNFSDRADAIKVGGHVITLNNRWGQSLVHWKSVCI